MATMLNGAAVMDAALLLIAGKCIVFLYKLSTIRVLKIEGKLNWSSIFIKISKLIDPV